MVRKVRSTSVGFHLRYIPLMPTNASATDFPHSQQTSLADYAICETSVQQNYLIKAPPSCLTPQKRLMKSERSSKQPKSKTLKAIQKNTV